MIEIHRYTAAYHRDWNDFVSESSNGTFLFLREYMEYHADRFTDYSLLVYDGNKLLALLPANRSGDVLYSHAGLTYGGLIVTTRNTTAQVLEIMRSIADFLKKERFVKWVYKCIPHIYHRYPSESDLYALFRLEARLIGRNISSTVQLDNPLRLRADRRSRMKKAEQAGLRVVETTDFSPFWKVLDANLQERFHVKPVHSLDEIVLLHSRFPDRIRHFVTMRGDETLAGSVIYDTGIIGKLKIKGNQKEIREIAFLRDPFPSVFFEGSGLSAVEGPAYTGNNLNCAEVAPVLKKACRQIQEYLEEEREEFTFPIRMEGTRFQEEVWCAMLDIPYGETRTYREIAEAAGSPKAWRAVGIAANHNRLPLVIPCHRVIGSRGRLTGYNGGLDIKEKLLTIESHRTMQKQLEE